MRDRPNSDLGTKKYILLRMPLPHLRHSKVANYKGNVLRGLCVVFKETYETLHFDDLQFNRPNLPTMGGMASPYTDQ